MKTDGTDVVQLTRYASGEQVYNPAWSPDGKSIVFDFSVTDGRDIMKVSAAGGTVEPVLATPDDERGAVFADGGKTIYFSSDRTGIFNIYRLDPATGAVGQITNVVGGAFMPEIGAGGSLAYAHYTSTGYKLALMAGPKALDAARAVREEGVRLRSARRLPGSRHRRDHAGDERLRLLEGRAVRLAVAAGVRRHQAARCDRREI